MTPTPSFRSMPTASRLPQYTSPASPIVDTLSGANNTGHLPRSAHGDKGGTVNTSQRLEASRTTRRGHYHNVFAEELRPQVHVAEPTLPALYHAESPYGREVSTGSLISGSSPASVRESPKARTLRRKPSVIGQYIAESKKPQPPSKMNALPEGDHSDCESSAILHVGLDLGSNRQSSITSPDRNANRSQPPLAKPRWLDEPPPPPPNIEAISKLYRHTPGSQTSVATSVPTSASPGAFSHATSLTSRTSCSPLVSASPHMGPGAWTTSSSTPAQVPQKEHTGSSNQPSGHPFFREALALSSPKQSKSTPADSNAAGERRSRSTSEGDSISERATKTHTPPELAHLLEDNTVPVAASNSPPRPSRANQPAINDSQNLRPVVQSNLPRLSMSTHRRQGSFGSQSLSGTPSSSGTADRRSMKSASAGRPSRIATKTAGSSSQSLPLPSPSPLSQQQSASSTKPATLGPEPARHKSRFGLFSRKAKPETSTVLDIGPKQPRKGPMAGTGHERYGKYAPGSRSGHVVSPPIKTARPTSIGSASSTSQRRKSNGSSQDVTLDDFLSQRLTPVYLRGGEGSLSGSQNRGSASTADDSAPRNSSASSPQTYQTSLTSFDSTRPDLASSSLSQNETASTQVLDDERGRKSTDKSIDGSQRLPSRSRSRKRLTKSPKVSEKAARKTSVTEPASTLPRPSVTSGSHAIGSSTSGVGGKGKEESNKKSKWSIRTKSAPGVKSSSKWNFFHRTQPEYLDEQVEVPPPQAPSKRTPYKSVAHYDLQDDDPGLEPFQNLGSIMREAEAVAAEDTASIYTDFEDADDYRFASRRESMSVGSKWLSPEHQDISGNQMHPDVDKSFEPQARLEGAPSEPTPGKQALPSRQPRLAQVGRIPKVVSSRGEEQMQPKAVASSSSELREPAAQIAVSADVPNEEFLHLNTRKNSDTSYSGSSGTVYFPTAAANACPPGSLTSPSEDEVWQEFDDLLNEVITPPSLLSGHDSLADVQDYFARQETGKDRTQTFGEKGKSRFDNAAQHSQPTRNTTQPEPVLKGILKATKGYCNVKDRPVERKRSSSLQQSQQQPEPIRHKRSLSDSEVAKTQEDVQEQFEETPTEIKRNSRSVINLRFRALLASKWLSFGQVLFSPAHQELRDAVNGRILVIDGLGKDWSYYCALTYPKATVYNLGPEPSTQGSRSSLSGYDSPANHQHFSHPGIGYNFPFPKGFFAAVVLRFPSATSDAALQSAICECKRVLRPGGYFELSTLDLDLANMGSRARRALRALKTDMQTVRPDVSLKPTSDNMQYLIGRRGFENLNRCIVGVPVAGVISDSREGSREENDLDVSKLVNDESKEGDEHITKMIARVGRWWYSHCYESILRRADKDSIWEDKALLRECEAMSTTFKLLICYAQKPTVAKRRTVSL
ncbi:MAG: hypothetical protein M1828_006591 [Chrysothrix sp. TS-e1954]|nr:MAG: hypothetical protein M1828_006591 [Chrysothrix sp. TS-e1954]